MAKNVAKTLIGSADIVGGLWLASRLLAPPEAQAAPSPTPVPEAPPLPIITPTGGPAYQITQIVVMTPLGAQALGGPWTLDWKLHPMSITQVRWNTGGYWEYEINGLPGAWIPEPWLTLG